MITKQHGKQKSEVTATLEENQTLDIDSVTKYRYKCPLMKQTITGSSSFNKTYGGSAFNLGAKAETSLTYKSSNTKIATVSRAGKVTMRNPGTVTITVSTPGNSMYKPASKKVKINISLKKPVLTMKYYRSTRKVQLRWTAVPGVTRYQVYQYNYSTKKYFLKGTCSSKAIGCSWIRGSKAKTYKCKVRAYRVVDGKKVYGPYSTAKILRAK